MRVKNNNVVVFGIIIIVIEININNINIKVCVIILIKIKLLFILINFLLFYRSNKLSLSRSIFFSERTS